MPPVNSTGHVGNGGFFPFGISGMFQGAALVLFTFIGFDSMAYYPLNWYASKAHQIGKFQKTVTTSILSINGILFISLIGTTVALTSIWPYYLLVKIQLNVYIYTFNSRMQYARTHRHTKKADSQSRELTIHPLHVCFLIRRRKIYRCRMHLPTSVGPGRFSSY